MAASDRERWDEKYAEATVPDRLEPDDWLRECVTSLLPGRALEVACGLGHNALWLASQGWSVTAVDISPVAIHMAQNWGRKLGIEVDWQLCDIEELHLSESSFDLISVFRFLDREDLPRMIPPALRPNGHLVYETFSAKQFSRADNHLKNPAFAFQRGEPERLYPELLTVEKTEVALADRTVLGWLARKT